MVRGLDVFREHFADYSEQYVLIGGTACTLALENGGLEFRSTNDLDIVLYVEVLDANFVKSFWTFIKNGKYKNKQKSNGYPQHYRFSEPLDDSFPKMLELFSRKLDILKLPDDAEITPIPFEDDISSLSAILLDDEYYRLVQTGKNITAEGLPVVKLEYLIPLKIYAWIDLREKRIKGERIDSNKIKKHRNDIFRLCQLLDSVTIIHLEKRVYKDIEKGIRLLEQEEPINLKALGLKDQTFQQVIDMLKKSYQL